MGKLIQIHDVPEDVHGELKLRAAEEGMSLSAFLRAELEQIAGTPRLEDVLAELRTHEPVELDEPPEEFIRRLREEGFRSFDDP